MNLSYKYFGKIFYGSLPLGFNNLLTFGIDLDTDLIVSVAQV